MFYNLGIHLYTSLLRVAAFSNRKARLMMQGRSETLSKIRSARHAGECWIWVHAASLGEFEQGRPLMERIAAENPGLKIALTFYSPSGYEVRKNYAGAHLVAYLPADTPRAMRAFIEALDPELAIIVKYEFWRNCLRELKRRDIPTLLVSAVFRHGQLFFRPWGGWYRKMLRCFTSIFVQDEQSRELLASIGIDNVRVAGDTRFDRVTDIMRSTCDIPQIDVFARSVSRLCMVFGSSWEADERVYFPWLISMRGAVKAVIAPHEFDSRRLQQMRSSLSPLRVVLLSEVKDNLSLAAAADVLIIDCFGLLSSAYRYGAVAYVGGGFGAGIHNINEAAVYGIPVVFGPRHDKFIEARELIRSGGGVSVSDRADFERIMNNDRLLCPDFRKRAGDAAGAYIRSKLGATDIIYEALKLDKRTGQTIH